MQWFSKNAVLFSVKTCLAAFIALYIALELNLDKPAWALTTVYVSSQLYAASTLSKSVFRLLGTLLGGIFIFLIYPLTVQTPLLFSLCVSLWVSFCLYLSLHDRTPKSYVFMLAGYSAAIMGFPGVTHPLTISETVISRIEEITLGIVCSSLVHRLIFPVSMKSLLTQSVSGWYQSGSQLCRDLLTEMHSNRSTEREEILIRMAALPQQVETLITHCVYEGEAARKVTRLINVQYQHLSYLIPTLTAIEVRLQRLSLLNAAVPEPAARALKQFLLWLNDSNNAHSVAVVEDTFAIAQTQLKDNWRRGAFSTEECLLLTGLLERLADFVRIAGAYHSISARVSNLSESVPAGRTAQTHRHIDQGMLMLSATTAFLATFGACLFWMATGWASGATAPMMAAILSSFFATADTPVNSMKQFVRGVLIALAISILYIALLIPQTVTLEALYLCLTPGLFALGLAIARPSSNMMGLSAATQIPGFIGMSHHFAPDVVAVINTAISSMVGLLFTVVITALIRNKRPSWSALRALHTGLRDLLRFVKETERNGSSLLARHHFIAGTLDKVNFILPRLRLDPHPKLVSSGNLIKEVWLGVSCYDYYARHREILLQYQLDSAQMFHEISLYLTRKMKVLQTTPHQDLLDELDYLLIHLEFHAENDEAVFMPLFYLFSIRLQLFPGKIWPDNSRLLESI
ncbi:FUSC family protein [Pantoea sp. MQR6]|uniref:FUSC family protein n=1 Tax=Pantoea sp. MQR6 TaxID=2907307 RepID=UPI001FA99C46|nr:FUSC family protein [Pantoea sp. MQR6]